MRDNTIFDDVFRTMMEKMTFLVVPLINDVFHTSYPADVEIVNKRIKMKDNNLIFLYMSDLSPAAGMNDV